METFNRIEIQGMLFDPSSPIVFAGQIVGYKFSVRVDRAPADGDRRLYSYIPCHVMLLPGTPTANFKCSERRPVHLKGRLTGQDGHPLVEVTEIEYLEED